MKYPNKSHFSTISAASLLAIASALGGCLAGYDADTRSEGQDSDAVGGTGGGEGGQGSDPGNGAGGTSGAGDDAGAGGAGTDEGGAEPDDEGGVETGGETGDETGTTGEPAQCDAQSPVELFLSPDDSNSMSSPVQAREAVLSSFSSIWHVPLRTWEFLNYYSFDYPAAESGAVTVSPSLARDPDDPEGEYVLQIGVASEAVSNEDRAPINIVLVLDTSGSMGGHSMDMLKASSRAIASNLKQGDSISMVTWSTTNAVVLGGYQVTGPDDGMLMSRIDELSAGGGTDLHGGLVAGYELAQQVYDTDRINRIVLISDGGANVGITDIELIAQQALGNDGDGIYMVGVGVGDAGSYHDELMDDVTDAGKGASVFISDEGEAWKVFGDDFVNTLSVAVRDVQVKLDMPPGFEIVKFSGEEYSADPAEIEPQHLAPNDAMVFHQRIATCAPQDVTEDSEITVTVRYKDAVTHEQRELATTVSFGEMLGQEGPQLLKGAAIFDYAEALKAFRDDDDGEAAVAGALESVARAEAVLDGDDDLAEIRTVLEALHVGQ